MGRILCDKHGRAPINLVCSHIATPTTLPTHCVVTVELYGEATDIRCCESCATKLRAQSVSNEAELELELSDAVLMCAICLADQY